MGLNRRRLVHRVHQSVLAEDRVKALAEDGLAKDRQLATMNAAVLLVLELSGSVVLAIEGLLRPDKRKSARRAGPIFGDATHRTYPSGTDITGYDIALSRSDSPQRTSSSHWVASSRRTQWVATERLRMEGRQ